MKLSIITINYNNVEGLRKTINSVIAQTFKDFEWIVIDGGSTDGSKELIEQHAEHFTYWVSEPDKGIYNAMNKGIRKATGEWIQCLNSGDWLYEATTLEQAFAHELKGDVVYGNAMYVDQQGGLHKKVDPDEIGLSFFYTLTICHQATFIRRELFADSLYEECYRIASDWAKWFEWMLAGKRFTHLNQYIVYFDMGGIGTVENRTAEHLQERAAIIERYVPYHVRLDMDKIVNAEAQWGFLLRRKTFRRWPQRFYRFSKFVDNQLCKIEARRRRSR